MRTPSLVAGGLLVALFYIILVVPLWDERDTDPSGPSRPITGPVPTAPGSNSVSEPSRRPGARPSFQRPAEAVTTLPPGFLEQASRQRSFALSLADHTSLSLTLTRASHAADQSVRSLEGTLSSPAPGRFIFHRQPGGVLPGPLAGVVFFPSLDYGYRLESAGGQPQLVRYPAEAIACLDYHGPADPEPQAVPDDHPADIPIPVYQNGVIPLQSRPSTVGVLYLDFDGEEGPHEGWGSFDAESWNFSNTKIKDIWERVAEDFAPFTLNITTDLQVYLQAPEASRQRCIITKTKDAAPTFGGIAFVGSFNWAGDTPCWSFLSSTKTSAESISHELGHTLSLTHDGRTSPAQTYYAGHGSGDTGWAPIMGNSYNKNLTQWSKGEYLNANNTQNDVSRIATMNNSVGTSSDDHGDTAPAATNLGFDPSGTVRDEGTIETSNDTDLFVFTTSTGGPLAIDIDPVALGPNLDILAHLHDDSGTLLESSNPADHLNATLRATVPAGTYTIHITNTSKGDPLTTGYTKYATLGQYVLSGTIPGVVLPEFFEIAENAAVASPVGTVAPRLAHDTHPLTWTISSGNDLGAFQIHPATGVLTVADPAILDVETLSPGWNDPPIFELTVELTDTADPGLNETIQAVVAVLDLNEAPTIHDATITILEHTLIGRTFLTIESSDPDQFDLLTFAITGGDPASRFSIDAEGKLSPASDLAFAEQNSYTLTITATDSGTPGLSDTATVTIHLLDTVEGYIPGQVEHTFYRELPGNLLSDLTSDPRFPECPDDLDLRPEIHAMEEADDYGRVVRAFLIPPLTGNYTFWIAGDHSCQLDLSPDANPAHATTIAFFDRTRFSEQESAPLALVAGQAYYLEARHKEGTGVDHLSLAWEVKDDSNNTLLAQEPIPGLFLAPSSTNYCPRLAAVTASLRDNAIPGTLVHDFEVHDLNAGDVHTFSITSGNSDGAFSIDPATGRLAVAPHSSLASSYQLGVNVTDHGSPPLMASTTLTINVIPGDAVAVAEPLMEFWDGLLGSELSTLLNSPRFPDRPDRLLALTALDSGLSNGTTYGARIRAYLTPPATGNYTFFLAADDQGTLLLSTDADPANATQIASVSAFTTYQQWDKYPADQSSAPVSLVAGQRYFIEARLKERGSLDHLSVGWTGPGISSVTVIDSSRIEPFDSNVAPSLSPLDSLADLPAAPAPGTSVATFSALDSPFETITFALLAGNEGNAFAIDPQSGELTVADPLALHPGPYTLTVAAQDAGHGGYFPLLTATTTLTLYLDDADHDSLPDPWELSQFGNLSANGSTDTDLDGLSNRGEFVFATLANDPVSFPRPEATGTWSPTTAQFAFRVRNDVPPSMYDMFLSTDLITWAPLTPADVTVLSATPLDSLRNRIIVEVNATGSNRYFRLGVD